MITVLPLMRLRLRLKATSSPVVMLRSRIPGDLVALIQSSRRFNDRGKRNSKATLHTNGNP
jgi:hypothetical protein